jgi:hypothetical protein
MPFDIPAALLHRLRARRLEQRQLRANQSGAHPSGRARGGNFIGSIRRLFSGAAPVDQVAEEYVAQMNAWQDATEDQYDAFLLDPGMGPMTYLTSDGRILEDRRGWDGDGIIEVEGIAANAALIVGARNTGVTELLGLLPQPPADSSVCAKCLGRRVVELVPGVGVELPCGECEARGWV